MQNTSRIDRFFHRWLPWLKTRLVNQVAGEVARECHNGLWQRLCDKTYLASIAEIRGYARAYTASLVREEVDRVFARRSLDNGLRLKVICAAGDQLVAMVVHDVLCEQPVYADRVVAA